MQDVSTKSEARTPKNEAELRYWLENMVWYHRYSVEEIGQVLGYSVEQVRSAMERLNISSENRPNRRPADRLKVLPYPGGRHPRIGFLDGAVDPQRETKVSVFTPWDAESYVVVDVPEAVWSNLGLTYLAHTHVPTLWSKMNQTLPRLEWKRGRNGVLTCERTLPNGIVFGAKVVPEKEGVSMELWLKNGTAETLSNLRIQNCVMLKAAKGFTHQTNDNKRFVSPYVACHDETGKRWVITAWQHCVHAWGNPPCPCLHSDPQFPDCAPGETVRLRGWLSFYEGDNVESEFARIGKRLQ